MLVASPKSVLEAGCSYFRVEVEGIENVPLSGKGLIIPNHSIWSGLDALILGHVLNKEIGRIPRILTLWNLLKPLPWLANVARRMGLTEASARNGIELLRKNRLTIVFPEGVGGSFKPSSLRYKLQPFHTGFVRMALLSNSPVVPCLVIGAEESQINLGSIHFSNVLKGVTLPVPFNLVPFPAKWKIRFLPPLDLSEFNVDDTTNKRLMAAIADRTREVMQAVLIQELQKREYIFFDRLIA